MITVTKRKNLVYILYDEELLGKCDVVMTFHVVIYVLMIIYIFLFKDSYKIYICLCFIFWMFFIICYKLQSYFSKTEVILYVDKVEINMKILVEEYLLERICQIYQQSMMR